MAYPTTVVPKTIADLVAKFVSNKGRPHVVSSNTKCR